MAFRLGMMLDLCMAYMLMLVAMTLMEVHSGSAEEEKKKKLNYLDN